MRKVVDGRDKPGHDAGAIRAHQIAIALDACVELDPHVGGNPTTAAEARKAVEGFLQALFKLG
jgi:hypothetical protein